MKQFEKDLKKLIEDIDKLKVNPLEKSVIKTTERDDYNLLLNRGLIELRPFQESEDVFSIHVTPKGYSYFLEKRYLRQGFVVQTVISAIFGAVFGFAASALFDLL